MAQIQSFLTINGLLAYDNTLFDEIILPEGMSKDDLVSNICIECGNLELMLPDTDVLKRAIGVWSRNSLRNWQMMYNALMADYNPIENYDRKEDWTTTDIGDTTMTSTNKTAAFNADTMVARESNESTGKANNNNIRSGRSHGNIGVTTNQQMISEELKLRLQNIYDYITNDFKYRYCIMVY